MTTADTHAAIRSMLAPRSIAVIGASPKAGYGSRFLAKVLRSTPQVAVYPVNPRYDEILGAKAYPGLAGLPETPDLAAIIVPQQAVLQALKDVHTRGTKSAIIISAGFSERGDEAGRAAEQEITTFARESGLRFAGPNCLGHLNARSDLWLTATSRELPVRSGPIGVICQSGATLFGPVLARTVDAGVGLSYAVSTGNEADLDFCDFAEFMLDDPDTHVIAGYVEGFRDPARFIDIARRALEKDKPIILIKIGRSDYGSRAAGSHTASLTGSDQLYDAVFRQYGVLRVESYDQMLEVAQLLARGRRQPIRNVAVVSHSGGISSLSADLLGAGGFVLPDLSADAQGAIGEILGDFGSIANPADITGHAHKETFSVIARHLLAESAVDTLIIASASNAQHSQAALDLAAETAKSVVYFWTGSRNSDKGLPELRAGGLPLFYSPEALVRGMTLLNNYCSARADHLAAADDTARVVLESGDGRATLAGLTGALSEDASRLILERWGLPFVRSQLATTADEAMAFSATLDGPVVLKIASADIPHKTEADGVRVGVSGADAVRAAFDQIIANALAYAPDARIDGVLVQEMAAGGVETLIGAIHDPQLGPFVVFGTGGTMVEVFGDVAYRRAPLTERDARAMIAEVRGSVLLNGFRGAAPADTTALVDVLMRLGDAAVALDSAFGSIDLNPVLVRPRGEGVVILDALITRD